VIERAFVFVPLDSSLVLVIHHPLRKFPPPPVSTRRNFLSWSARFFIMGLWRLAAPRKDPAISEPGLRWVPDSQLGEKIGGAEPTLGSARTI